MVALAAATLGFVLALVFSEGVHFDTLHSKFGLGKKKIYLIEYNGFVLICFVCCVVFLFLLLLYLSLFFSFFFYEGIPSKLDLERKMFIDQVLLLFVFFCMFLFYSSCVILCSSFSHKINDFFS